MARETITLKGVPVHNEAVADEAITPGHLVELTATGIKKHATSGARSERAFALEDELRGNEIATAYSSSNIAQYGIFRPGDEVFARVTGSPAVGTFLCSNGDGTLRAAKKDSSGGIEEWAVAVLLEAVASSKARVRII